jgi:Trypsin-co-occurring domain 1
VAPARFFIAVVAERSMSGFPQQFILPSGQSLDIEVSVSNSTTAPATTGYGQAGAGQKLAAKALELSSSFSGLSDAMGSLVAGLFDSANVPAEITIEVGIKIGASGNVIVAGSSGEANFRIALKYVNNHASNVKSSVPIDTPNPT